MFLSIPLAAVIGGIVFGRSPKKKKSQSTSQPTSVKKENETKKESAPVETVARKNLPEDMSDEIKIVYSVLNENGVHIDDIVRETNLKMNVVLSSLTELELLDLVQLENGKKYKII